VNGNLTFTVNSTEGAFNLTLTPEKADTLQVYALFNGTDLYLPSRSNTVSSRSCQRKATRGGI
jgi:hypothetical protein